MSFEQNAFEDLQYWLQNDIKLLKKIFDLIKDIQRNPFRGIGKPEPLKNNLSGLWSRRMNKEHRLIYQVTNDEILIIACRFHYDK